MRVTKKFLAPAIIAAAALTLVGCAPTAGGDAGGGATEAAAAPVNIGMITSHHRPARRLRRRATSRASRPASTTRPRAPGEIDGHRPHDRVDRRPGQPRHRGHAGEGRHRPGLPDHRRLRASGVALAVAEQAAQNNTLFLSGPAAADAITGVNDQTFRSGRQTLPGRRDRRRPSSTSVDGSNIVVFAQDNAFGQGNVASVRGRARRQGRHRARASWWPRTRPSSPRSRSRSSTPRPTSCSSRGPAPPPAPCGRRSAQQRCSSRPPSSPASPTASTYQAYGPGSATRSSFLNHYFPGRPTPTSRQAMDAYLEAAGTRGRPVHAGRLRRRADARARDHRGRGDVDAMIGALEGWTFESVKGRAHHPRGGPRADPADVPGASLVDDGGTLDARAHRDRRRRGRRPARRRRVASDDRPRAQLDAVGLQIGGARILRDVSIAVAHRGDARGHRPQRCWQDHAVQHHLGGAHRHQRHACCLDGDDVTRSQGAPAGAGSASAARSRPRACSPASRAGENVRLAAQSKLGGATSPWRFPRADDDAAAIIAATAASRRWASAHHARHLGRRALARRQAQARDRDADRHRARGRAARRAHGRRRLRRCRRPRRGDPRGSTPPAAPC